MELRLRYMASTCLTIMLVVEYKYRETLKRARALAGDDARLYDDIWATLRTQHQIDGAVGGLVEAYRAAMAIDEKRPKRQPAATVGKLFDEAGAIYPLISAKLSTLLGAEVKGNVKTVGRAFQKAWRSYGGDHRRLCDVSRASATCYTIEELTACLNKIAADPEIALLPQGMGKCRSRAARTSRTGSRRTPRPTPQPDAAATPRPAR